MSPLLLGALSVAAALLVPVLLFYLLGRKRGGGLYHRLRSRGKAIVLCGSSGIGKTRLFLALVAPSDASPSISTVSSGSINTGRTSNGVSVLDVPGSEKVRELYLDEALQQARCIVYFVSPSPRPADAALLIKIIASAIAMGANLVLVVAAAPPQDDGLPAPTKILQKEMQQLAHQLLLPPSSSHTDDTNVQEEGVDGNKTALRTHFELITRALHLQDDDPNLPEMLTFARLAPLVAGPSGGTSAPIDDLFVQLAVDETASIENAADLIRLRV